MTTRVDFVTLAYRMTPSITTSTMTRVVCAIRRCRMTLLIRLLSMIVVAVAVAVAPMMFRARSLPVIVSAVAVAADIRLDGMLAGAQFAHPFQFGDQCL